MKDKALKLAQQVLKSLPGFRADIDNALDAIKETLAQPAQEPVAWAVVGDGKFGEYELGQVFVDYASTHTYWENRGYELVPVYTTLPQRPWVGLTPEEILDLFDTTNVYGSKWVEFARAVEAKLKEKNNG